MTTTPEYDAILARKMAERAQKLLDDGKCVSRSEARRVSTLMTAKEERMHKVTTMTEGETQAEIERIQDGAKSSFEEEVTITPVPIITPTAKELDLLAVTVLKKRRGRPPGSKNKPKK